ncbi:hypothetical protein Fcan01_17941 [Folsomia candida]|uniref:CCHC-type domain-containing protein n=1 Tax=Folsomia candida TaxID=158441 RepID=A0A226DQF5_FOLCA|nr:hypothetical protein Fcan01_17941 [Folsomia candida]
MDRPRRARGPLRRVFTTLVNEMKEELAKEDPDEEVQLSRLEGYAEKKTHFDNVTMDALLDSNATEEELNEETLSCEEYNKKLEVRNEERISLARSGFGMTKDKKSRLKEDGGGDNYATSAGLFSGQKTECVFCKKPHPTQDCFRAKTLSYNVKRQKLQEMRCCFSCLKVGHTAIKCRNQMRCQVCQEKHPTVMCPGLSIPRTRPENLFELFGRERHESSG